MPWSDSLPTTRRERSETTAAVAVERYGPRVASYEVNEKAIAKARAMIDARQYVLDSDWGEVQPSTDDENSFLETHSWDDYAVWHLGLTVGANDETKARHAFVFGDFRRLHRSG